MNALNETIPHFVNSSPISLKMAGITLEIHSAYLALSEMDCEKNVKYVQKHEILINLLKKLIENHFIQKTVIFAFLEIKDI